MTLAVKYPAPSGFRAAVGDTLALAGRHVRHLRRAPGKLIGITMNPLVMMLTIGYLFKDSIVTPTTGSYQEYIFAGIAAQVALSSIGPTAIGVASALRGGLIDRFRSLPISRATVLIGHTLSDLMVASISLAVVTGVAVLVGWRIHTDLLSAVVGFALLMVFIYVMLWVAVLLGLVLRDLETIESIGAITLVLFSFLSSAFLSVEKLPAWIRPIAEWNPVSSVVATCRQLWGNPVAPSDTFPGQHPELVTAISLTAMLLISVPLALRAYRKSVLP